MEKPKFDYGNPMFNLEITINHGESWWGNKKDIPAVQKAYEDAIGYANRSLGGLKHVTEKGYLLDGHINRFPRLPIRKAKLEVDHHVTDLHKLAQGLDGIVHIHYEDRDLSHIRADENGFYIVELKE